MVTPFSRRVRGRGKGGGVTNPSPTMSWRRLEPWFPYFVDGRVKGGTVGEEFRPRATAPHSDNAPSSEVCWWTNTPNRSKATISRDSS